jgi:hypothetical protein
MARRTPVLIAIAPLLLPVLYLASFGWFWATPIQFDLAHPDDPKHYLVIFSRNTETHSLARTIYWPLISTIGGHRHYPNRQEHEILFSAKQ